jgi:hypothetical protein
MVQWLLEYGGARITDKNNAGDAAWIVQSDDSLRDSLINAYKKDDDGEYISIDGEHVPTKDTVVTTTMLRVMMLHGGPSESLTAVLAPPLQQIMEDGARLRARLAVYLTQRLVLLDAHCPLLPLLLDLVHGYEEPTTTDELWATGLGTRAKRSRPERAKNPERRSARLRQKRL